MTIYSLSHGSKEIASRFHILSSLKLKGIILKDPTTGRRHSRNITKSPNLPMFRCLQTIRNIPNKDKKVPDIVIIHDLRVHMHEVQLVVFVCWVNFGKVDVI